MRRMWVRYRGLSTKWQVVIGVIVGMFVLSAIGSASSKDEATVKTEQAAATSPTSEMTTTTAQAAPAATTTAAPTTTTTAAPTTTTTPPTTEAPAPRESVSQSNARRSAASYLDMTAFSRKGLIDQLVFEGFSQEDATYGVDALNADWNEQAAKSAASYLEMTSFSHSSLVDQLVFEGFTPAQAEYGVGTTGL
jgi:hypothetical protein